MKSVPKTWNIYIVAQREKKINPRPQYQRAPVWNLEKKQRLIDSILRGYDVPKFYLRISPDTTYEHEVVDGQQRLRAIWEFMKDEYELGEVSDDLPTFGDLSGKSFETLSSDAVDKIGMFELSVLIIEEATELEVRDLFLRLQEGVTLNPAEKRNAMPGKLRDFIAELAKHAVFQHVSMGKSARARYGQDDWIAHVACLELAGAHTDVKATNLKRMYEDNQQFNVRSPKAKKIERTLNYMTKVLKAETPEMNIKWGFVDLYWLISNLIDDYVLTNRHKDLHTFYLNFEKRRRAVEDMEDLIKSKDYLDRELFDYIQAFQRSGAVKKNIETRHRVYLQWFYSLFPDLVPKDQTRAFTHDERLFIWRHANESCEQCGREIKFNEMHADHVIPHSKGGETTLDNAQCLCVDCSLKKSDILPTK